MKHHATAKELILRCSKTAAAPTGVTYRQALDGVSFSVRFSPRQRKKLLAVIRFPE